jgi:hypothetical protein
VSLHAQRAKVTAYAKLYDLELAEVTVDAGESAKHLDRPGLQRALGMLKRGEADALLVVKLDRLTRSVRDLGHLVEKYFAPGKAALLSVGEQIDTRSAAGRLVLNVLASVSQWERRCFMVGLHLCGTRPRAPLWGFGHHAWWRPAASSHLRPSSCANFGQRFSNSKVTAC